MQFYCKNVFIFSKQTVSSKCYLVNKDKCSFVSLGSAINILPLHQKYQKCWYRWNIAWYFIWASQKLSQWEDSRKKRCLKILKKLKRNKCTFLQDIVENMLDILYILCFFSCFRTISKLMATFSFTFHSCNINYHLSPSFSDYQNR